MAVRIELKRSNVPGKIPSTSQLQLGEVALNTYDGAAYFKKNVGGTETIVQLATTTGTGSGTVTSASHADYADTAGYATNAGSAATAVSASYAFNASNAVSSSYAVTASFADNAPNAVSASYAQTASYSDNFNIGNNLTVVGTITAQKLVVQVITSSTEFVTGSTIFGSQLTDTHQFTGSVSITGSLSVNGVDYIQTSASFDGRINGISGSFITSASFNSFTASTNDSLADIKNATASLYAATASIYNATASLYAATASIYNATQSLYEATASLYAFTASILNHSSSISASVDALNNFSASILNYTASNNDNIAALYAATASLYNATASIYATTQSLSASIGSLSSSFLSTSSSLSIRVSDLEAFSSSLDATFATDAQLNYSSSVLSGSTAYLSASFLSVSASNSTRIYDLEQFSSSLDATFATDAQLNYSSSVLSGSTAYLSASFLNTSASNSTRILALEQFSSSLDATFATDADLNALSSSFIAFTASINNYTSSNNNNIAALYAATASLNNATASLYNFSASINNFTSSTNNAITQLYNETASILAATASIYNATSSLYAFSASINSFTASQLILNGTFATTASNTFIGNQVISGSLNVTSGITGSLLGTSSYAVSASYASSASNAEFASRTTQVDVYVKNSTGVQINKGTVVRIIGSVGDNPLIQTASYTDDANSANTLGITTENIANDSFGYVITEGILTGINTDGYTAGQLLYLGANGTITGSAPLAPLHAVRLGEVLRPQLNAGSMYVRVDNGYEIGELHDVRDFSTSSSYGDLFIKSGSVWTNSRSLTGSYSLTGSLNGGTINSTSLTSSNALITNNLVVNGTASFNYVETITGSAVIVGQEYIILNTQTPAARYAGIKVYDSGSNSTASIVWDSLTNHWIYENGSGSSYSGGGFLAGPRNTGSLADITYPTQYRVLRSQGDDHIYNSNIIDNDIKVSIGLNTEVTGNLYVTNGITGSLLGNVVGNLTGTASYWSGSITNALSASFASTASFVQLAQSASYWSGSIVNALSASHAETASYWSGSILNVLSASFADNANNAINAQTASYVVLAQSASYWSGSIINALSASFADNANNSINAQTASYVVLAQSASYWSGSIQNAVSAAFADFANSASFATTASFALNAGSGGGGGLSALYIQDEGITQGTASYIDFTGAGVTATVTNGTASITIPGGGGTGGSAQTFTQSLASTTWSFAHSVNSRTPIVEVYDNSYNVIIPTAIYNPGPFNTNIYFDVSQSGYAIISTGGVLAVSGSNAVLNQNASATTWSFNHDLHTQYPVFTIYDSNDDVIIPQRIHVVDTGSAEIYFSTPRTGKAIASVGGNVSFASQSISTVTASFAATASSADDFLVRGTITAQTLLVQVITSSQDFVTGSTKFGTLLSNTHQFTGSVLVTGSLNVNGSDAILTNQTSSMSVLSSSYAATASFALNVPQTASFALSASNAVTASYIATASFALTASYAENAGAGAGFPYSGSAVITGSLLVSESFVDFSQASWVSGSFTGSLNGTASWANNAISASYAAVAGNSPGFTVNFTQSVAAATWSFVHNLNTRNPIVQVYDTTYKQIIPNEIVATDSATVEVRFDYNQAGYAVASNGGGLYITGSTSRILQTAAATTWSFNHKLNTKYPAFEVYDSSDNVIIPAGIKAVDTDNAEIYFASPTSGIAIAEFSGINGLQDNAVSASFASTASYLNPVTSGYVVLTQVSQSLNFVDDAAAATGGVPLGGLYRNGNFIMIRLT